MKILAIGLGLILLAGCASTPPPEPAVIAVEPVIVNNEGTITTDRREKVKICILELVAQEAHVLDATEACIRVYGEHNEQRTPRKVPAL